MQENSNTYGADVQRIKDIIAQLQAGCDVDNMLALVTEASQLLAKCQEKLGRTGLQIDEALKKIESMASNQAPET